MTDSIPAQMFVLLWKWRLLILLLLAGWGTWILLRSIETMLLFPAPRASSPLLLPEGAHLERVKTPVGEVEAVLLPALIASNQPAPLLLYCHGNGNLIDHQLKRFDNFRKAGFAVLLAEYPGYGRSQGSPSDRSIEKAVVAIYDWGIQQPGIDSQTVIGYGRSMGGGAICLLSRHRPLSAMILESTYTSIVDAARDHYGWITRFMANRFDNLSVVTTFDKPILILHGNQDHIVSIGHAEKLHAANPDSEYIVLPCGHNDCESSHRHALEFLKKQAFVKSSP